MRIEIDGNYTGIRFSASHFIPGHDKCGRLHGHSYVLHLVLEGDNNEQGMVMDFVELKKALRSIVESLDHKVLIPERSPVLQISKAKEIEVKNGNKRYVFPAEDVALLEVSQTSAEELADMITSRLMSEIAFPSNVSTIEVGIDEERGQTAWSKRKVNQ